MIDRAIPNLPSTNLAATAEFYGKFGFERIHQDDKWLILRRGYLQIEFFLNEQLHVGNHDFACCLRVNDLSELYYAIRDSGVPEKRYGLPSIRPIKLQPWGQQMSTVLDPDGNLLRMIAESDSRSTAP